MSISMIVAMSKNRAIGVDNKMPWHLPAELAHFKRTTLNKTVLMGRKTFESIGKPLPKRLNVILSRQKDLVIEGCEVVHSVEEAISKYGQDEELMVTGGSEVFDLFMPYVDTIYLTEIDLHVENADAFFPVYDEAQFEVVSSEAYQEDEKNPYSFIVYTLKKK